MGPLGTASSPLDPIVVRLVFFYTAAGDVHWIYDVIGISLVGTTLAILIMLSRAPRARNAFVALLVLFGTLSAGWFTLAKTDAWATFAVVRRSAADLRRTCMLLPGRPLAG